MPASSRLSFESRRILDLLTFEWQPFEPMLAEVMKLVPPGRALREYQKRSEASRLKTKGVLPSRHMSEEDQLKSGARAIVNSLLHSLIEGGRVELRGRGRDREVRLRERRRPVPCSHCGKLPDGSYPSGDGTVVGVVEVDDGAAVGRVIHLDPGVPRAGVSYLVERREGARRVDGS